MTDNEKLDLAALVLVIIGGVNWGLVGLGEFLDMNLNLVELTAGQVSAQASAVVYLLVGLSALYTAYFTYEWYEE